MVMVDRRLVPIDREAVWCEVAKYVTLTVRSCEPVITLSALEKMAPMTCTSERGHAKVPSHNCACVYLECMARQSVLDLTIVEAPQSRHSIAG